MSIWEVGVELKGIIEGSDGRSEIALFMKSCTKVVVSLWKAKIEL